MSHEVVFGSLVLGYVLAGFGLLKMSLSSPAPKMALARIRVRNGRS